MFEWVLSIIDNSGYAGIFFLMVLENVFPPIPSELIIPMAGFAAAQGKLSILGAIAATTGGALAGALLWYFLGRLFGLAGVKRFSRKYGRLLTMSPEDIESAQEWFKKHGHLAVFFGRLVPGVRTLISIPAGLARMPFIPFFLYSLFGTLLWNMTLLLSGFVLESQYTKIAGYVDFVSNAFFGAMLALYLYRVATYKHRNKKTAP